MADKDGMKAAKNYHLDIPFSGGENIGSVRGIQGLDWGMQKRMSNIFNPKTGKTVMLAFDHGYFMGSTSGLERLDLLVPQLMDKVDVLMGTRGAFRTCVPSTANCGIALRVSAGSSVLDEDLSHEVVAVDIADAIRLDADAMAVQVFIGADGEKESIDNLSRVINSGLRCGIPTLGVVAVGKQMERTPKYFKLATRMIAELGAQIVKTYYCDEMEEIVAACPVPIVIAGGKKVPEAEALEMVYRGIRSGAAGVDMGRNVFQSEHPAAMAEAVARIVHGGEDSKHAYEFYLDSTGSGK